PVTCRMRRSAYSVAPVIGRDAHEVAV
ncbi:MAG: hypothetical protein QOD73_87, partial [Solirubrobacteraceae bacterium]|nr:hypothetical protein [Solirubrobacteraceae bacterium]